jgi:hypothetical protein
MARTPSKASGVRAIARADEPFGAEREHLAPGAQRDRPRVDFGEALQQVDAGAVDRPGAGATPAA